MEETELWNQWTTLIKKKGEFRQDTSDALACILNRFFEQIVGDAIQLKNTNTLTPSDIFNALENRHLNILLANAKKDYIDNLNKIKHEKIVALRNAGYGATSDHVSFVRKVLASQHLEYQQPETYDFDTDDDI
ncbi:hypothetical protein GPJ56_003091 [Histomonas meleagridis]|uniref:uncharacterized protein n=1 Tax=Histomonas meleagridis TaxID=135588 RepID=UPI00355A5C50|nr:hypothetical protein GPJ56_003091 [Histomonas meleagridis]KAH0805136.1 hypothetical protein GO595_002081 [Histomonas meleagridis]